MICIPIMAVTNAAMRELIAQARSEPADLYEFRLDALEEEPDIIGLLAAADKPVIATCRSAELGGAHTRTADERTAVLQSAIDAGAQYVDADEDVVGRLRRRDGLTIIASWHDMEGTPANLDAIAARLSALPCDWIKFATMATKCSDNITVLQTLSRSEKPAIGIAMGEIGLASRILGLAFGSRVAFGTSLPGNESAPGQPTARELESVYRVRQISKKTAVYGLLGNPVRHSLGYRIHNLGFSLTGTDAVYIPFQCTDAEDFRNSMFEGINLQGLSITMPYKKEAYAWADTVAPSAEPVGVTNTLVRDSGGWRAENTDFLAARAAVADKAQGRTLVLGGGGAARAIGAGLASLGCRVFLSGRNAELRPRLAEETGWDRVPWDERGDGDWTVVANATPIGMYPDTDASSFPAASWRKGMLAFDAVYRPSDTRFLREAAKAGAWTVDGMEMFTRQAAEQFAIWTNKKLPSECRELVEGLARQR